MKKYSPRSAFTIVELIVVITVIAILAGITLVSYGAWRTSVSTSSVKSDLAQAASTMESARSFDTGYPLTIPSSFTASNGLTITLSNTSTTKAFCIDGTSASNSSIQYYIDTSIQAGGAQSGTCTGRTGLVIPSQVANVAFTTSSSQITVTWTLPTPNNATQYIVQCSQDPAFVNGLLESTVSGTATTTTMPTVNAGTSYYCRVKGGNANGQGSWSSVGSGTTLAKTCSDTSQYGTYPDCYNYDSLVAGTSISGYWSIAPDGYLLEDGSAVSRTSFADLFAIIGSTYGSGDGSTTFNLPDSRGRVTVPISSVDAEYNSIGEKYGEKTHTITTNEIPAHTHMQYITANSGGTSIRVDYASDGNGIPYLQGINTGSTGGSGASNVTQPSIVKQYAIKWRASTGTASTLAPGTTLQSYSYSATVPTGYLNESGTAISRSTYSVLFGVTGTSNGSGDGSTTFNLPNSQGRVGVNRNTGDAEFSSIGQLYGSKTVILSIAQLAAHAHAQVVTANSGGPAVRDDYAADAAGGIFDQNVLTTSVGGGQAFNIIQPSIAKRSAIKTAAATGSQDDAGMKVGTSIEGWWGAAPAGYLLENGQAVSRTSYASLFGLIGTTYGTGDGSTTFNVPNSQGRVAVNRDMNDTQFDTIGEKSGEKTHIMTIGEMPSHAHGQYVSANSGGGAVRRDYSSDNSGVPYGQGVNTGTTGSSSAYNVIQPSITKMFAIKY